MKKKKKKIQMKKTNQIKKGKLINESDNFCS